MCPADAAWKNKKIYKSLWKCLDKVENVRKKFYKICLSLYRNIYKIWLSPYRNFQIRSKKKKSERVKLETLLQPERGLVWQLPFVPCIAAEWDKLLRALLDAGIGTRHWLWERLFCYCTMIELFEGSKWWRLCYGKSWAIAYCHLSASEETWSDYLSVGCAAAKKPWSQLRWCRCGFQSGSWMAGKRNVLNNCTIKHTSFLMCGLMSLDNGNISCPLDGLWLLLAL